MTEKIIRDVNKHVAFLASQLRHVLMFTIHGIHQWDIVPGLPDTGGQNVFVNQLSQALVDQGFKVTTVNRGGYPHPITGKVRIGFHYKDESQRILYLEDGVKGFIRKEDMQASIPALIEFLKKNLDLDSNPVDLIISHYWDGGMGGDLFKQSFPQIKHIWVPHSLGSIKKANVSPQHWEYLRIDARIQIETRLAQVVDGIGSTSTRIETALRQDYGYTGPIYWLPPCVDPDRFHPHRVPEGDAIWEFLSQHTQLTPAEAHSCQIITEVSRTDATKRKNILIAAFAQIHLRFPDTLLVVSIDDHQSDLAHELKALIQDLQIGSHTAVVGSIWDLLPTLYAVTEIYCTPSIMEGFGMSAQEAAATGVPIVASDKVPFAIEYLLGKNRRQIDASLASGKPLILGEGAIVVPADEVRGFTHALELLLSDEDLRGEMGARAYQITIPQFTWQAVVRAFLEAVDFKNDGRGGASRL
jgi:mannosylfructose-phosphate synthase